jgi:leucyl/phenylalanyl-tRNA--protein transferase
MPVYRLGPDPSLFPDPEQADADGLVAVGGDLSPRRVLAAYASGIFPWPVQRYALCWFSPDPRMLLYPDQLQVSRSLRKACARFEVRFDTAFGQVIRACAETPRRHERGTWITPDIVDAFQALHELGWAHSVEAWQDGELVGGLYGISIGRMFCGESMFYRVADASKVAFVGLVHEAERRRFAFVDCQIHTDHLASLGAAPVPRAQFLRELAVAVGAPSQPGSWARQA